MKTEEWYNVEEWGYEGKVVDVLYALERSERWQASTDSAQRDDMLIAVVRNALQPLYHEIKMLRGETM